MEKINKLLGRSKTFTGYDNKRKKRTTTHDDVVGQVTAEEFDKSSNQNQQQKLSYEQQYLAKVSNPSDPHGTLKRLEKENLRRPKIKRITGLGKSSQRNSISSEDIIIRNPSASPKPQRQRTKTMFDFFHRPKKSPLPTKKSSIKPSTSNTAISTSFKPPPNPFINDNRRTKIDLETVLKTSPFHKDRLPSLRKKPEFSSIEIDIEHKKSVPERKQSRMKQLQFTRMYSRSMNDVLHLPGEVQNNRQGSVRVLKEKFEDVPIMGRVSLINKAPLTIDTSISLSAKRRSSLPVDFKDLPATEKLKREKTMANPQQQQVSLPHSGSTLKKNSQHDLVPKSPTKFGDSSTNEDNQNTQKTSTNLKTIKNVLQRFLKMRPSQQELVTKGIIQDQKIFANSLKNLCKSLPVGSKKIPEFVSVIIEMIQDPRNVISHGIYRASGNIATIQKIRVRVNERNSLDILKEYRDDVDVLTGSFKLFFRELTEPLISTEMFQELCDLKDKELSDHDRLQSEADKIIKRQPDYHRDVLTALINHILYVNSFGDKNSMSIDSMSIVWGPSLIFTDNEDSKMLLQRITNNNSIVRFLLNIYNKNYCRTEYIPQRLYSCASTLSLASTSDKGSTTRSSFRRQYSLDDSLSLEDLELLIKSIQDSEIAKKNNIYLMYKGKKSKKIIERLKAKKSIEKYTTTKDGLHGIVDTLKNFVYHAAVVPEQFIKDYDGGTLTSKQIEAGLDRLPPTNKRILELVLNHLNDMQKINREKYSLNLLLDAWTKVLFVNYQANVNAAKCFEQLLEYYQRSTEHKIEQSTLHKHMMSDLSENLQLRSTRLSESETSLVDDGSEVLKRGSTDVEIRKSQLYQLREEQERKKNNRNS